jgi:hypothetical protein
MSLNVPEHRASDLRLMQSVQGKAIIFVLVAVFLIADAI